MKIKDKVNKTQLFRDLTEIGEKRFEFTCEPDEDLKVFLDGAEQLFKLLRLPDVIVPKGTFYCDCVQPSMQKPISETEYECFDCGKEVKQ